MLTIDYIRTNKDKVKEAAKNKNRDVEIEKILELDDSRKKLIQDIQLLRTERNEIAKNGKPDPAQEARGRNIKDQLKSLEEDLIAIERELNILLSYVPNVPLDEVPVGKNESGNIEMRKKGEAPQFSFAPKSHIELGLLLDIFDLERGSKVSGFRGYFLKNEGAILHFAVMFYVFMKLVKKGYTPIIAPSIVKGFTLFGTGQLPWGEQEVYKLNDEDAYLAGTAEVPVTAYYSGETLSEKELPKKFVAFSPCFRKEAGSYGKDTKGLYRVHEFWKIEQVILGRNNLDEAKALHEELQKNTQEILEDLGLAYRVMLMCTGDMGEPQIKKYDTEIWMPYKNGYGEIASNSILGDFQARRLNIKYRTKDGKSDYCYTLNDTAVPSPRILIAILENYQKEDGSIEIPQVLRSLVGFDSIKPKK
jgi:seryl-tRNA synthetase